MINMIRRRARSLRYRIRWKLIHAFLDEGPPPTSANPDYERYEIGRFTYGSPRVLDWDDGGRLVVGDFCSIADDVCILLGGNHHPEWVSTFPFHEYFPSASQVTGQPWSKGDVVLENDVWIGHGATILSGVTIGSGAIIAARSVVIRDVEPYSVVAGNPARHVKYRFDAATRSALLATRWWSWPLEQVDRAATLLMSDDLDAFLGLAAGEEPPRTDRENSGSG